KQKLHIARGILHRPSILFLDEPTIGLDPKSARETRKLVRSLEGDGVTILLTTHYMFEAEELCPRLAVLSKGRIVANDTVDALRHRIGGDRTIEVEAYGFEDRELATLRTLPGVSTVATEEFGPRVRLTLRTRTLETTLARVAGAVPGHPELSVRERRTSLEDVYLDLVEEEAT
ncbi:daunorubicin resistance ABC transporter ATPase subunit, partial [mine drainage metagenome]